MKKIYMQPQTAVVMIAQCKPIAGSNPAEDGVMLDRENDGIAPSSFGTKDQGDWDEWDDWDE